MTCWRCGALIPRDSRRVLCESCAGGMTNGPRPKAIGTMIFAQAPSRAPGGEVVVLIAPPPPPARDS